MWGIAKDHGLLQTDLTDALAQCLPGGYTDGQTVLQAGEEICLPPYFPDCQYVSNSGEGSLMLQSHASVLGGSLLLYLPVRHSSLLSPGQDLLDFAGVIVDATSTTETEASICQGGRAVRPRCAAAVASGPAC